MPIPLINPASTAAAHIAAQSFASVGQSTGSAATGGTDAVSTSSTDKTQAAQQPNLEQLTQALKDVQEAIKPVAQDLRFSIDQDTGETVVKIVDSATDKVIKQIPSKEMMAIAQAIDKLQGLLHKQEA